MQWTIPHLLAAGHEVIGVDNEARHGQTGRDRAYEFVRGDLCKSGFVDEVIDGADAVIQAAAQIYGVAGFHAHGADILARDTQLQIHLLRSAAERHIQRFVYVSSSMVYERSETVPTREDQVDEMKAPLTDYGLSKLMGERLTKAFARDYGVPYVVWRPFNIITPFERAEDVPGFAHVFADFLERIVIDRQNPLEVLGDGQQVRCFTWIDDVASAIARFSFDDRTIDREINIGNPEPVTMLELADRIFAKAQAKGAIPAGETLRFTHRPSFADDVRTRIPDIELAQQLLGWAPALRLEESLDRFIDQLLSDPRPQASPRDSRA